MPEVFQPVGGDAPYGVSFVWGELCVLSSKWFREGHPDSLCAANGNAFLDERVQAICREVIEADAPQPPRHQTRWMIRKSVVARDRGKCRYCGHPVGHDFHLDHVIPRAYGGEDEEENLVVACVPCNLAKGGRTPAEAGMELLAVGCSLETVY